MGTGKTAKGKAAMADRTNLTPNPGTPDELVSPVRLSGRRAAREHVASDPTGDSVCPPLSKPNRVDWWLGWYDERLKRFFGRR